MVVKVTIATILVCFIVGIRCDTPANCTYDDTQGKWRFYFTALTFDKTVDCSKMEKIQTTMDLSLYFPDVAEDQYGNLGFWTLIYNQGFEVQIDNRKHFGFFNYTGSGETVTYSYCNNTLPGWTHDDNGQQWGCFVGEKIGSVPPKRGFGPSTGNVKKLVYRNNMELINRINSVQSSWKAGFYSKFEGIPLEDMIQMAGGPKSFIAQRPDPAPVTYEQRKRAESLPESFDWRNVDGIDYVSPVRDQGSCGSCYAFASLAMDEARIRIRSNNTDLPIFSPQDIVECSEYSQGCAGGFPYLIAGKYAEDFGLVEEHCNTYTGKDGKCKTEKSCERQYATEYRYVGGYYGACNEPLMMEALVENGPVAVGFEVYSDFQSYTGGIYHHIPSLTDSGFNPFYKINHAVLLIGYGTEDSQDYWTCKNSWGTDWGEQGYFRIRRGNNECGMETIGLESVPVG